MSKSQRYAAFLLGINIGKHKPVPMAELKQMCEGMGFENVRTLLASGNVALVAKKHSNTALAKKIEEQLELTFGFEVGVIVRTMAELMKFVETDPFAKVKVTKDTRLYVTFLEEQPAEKIETPLKVEDKRGGKFRILAVRDSAVFSVVELGKSKTTDAMNILKEMFGEKITTRNWNTILKLVG